jgi:hypothetical protein
MFLSTIQTVSLMTNGWKSSAAYCSTADFFTKVLTWKDLFSYKHVKAERTGNSLLEELKGMVAEWGLDQTEDSLPVYVVTDIRNFDSTISECSWVPIQCFVHILKLGIGDAKKPKPGTEDLCQKGVPIIGCYNHILMLVNGSRIYKERLIFQFMS